MNILIVESENDEYFVQALLNKESDNNRVNSIDVFKYSSLSEEKLKIQIASALKDVNRGDGVSKIGIILDMDDSNQTDRINLINRSLTSALNDLSYSVPTVLLTDVKTFITIPIDSQDIQIACYFTNIDGQGELETILKQIAKEESSFANCLEEGWKNCFIQKGKKLVGPNETGDITHKEILKLWVDIYKRLDTLKKGSRNEDSTCWKGIMLGETKKGKKVAPRGEIIFNLNSPILDELKSFLQMFN
jgi:hypothetical protein